MTNITKQLIDKTAEKIKDQLYSEYGEFEVDMFLINQNFFDYNGDYIKVNYYELEEVDWDYFVDNFIFYNANDDEQKEHWETMYQENGIDYFLYQNESEYNINLFKKFIKSRDILTYDELIERFPIYEDIKNDKRTNDYLMLDEANGVLRYGSNDRKKQVKDIINKYNKKVNKP